MKHQCKKRGTVLATAHDIINGERQNQYGAPEDSFELIAAYWNAFLMENKSRALTGKHVAQMMALFKIARMQLGEDKLDNYVDAAGYIALAADAAFPVNPHDEPIQPFTPAEGLILPQPQVLK